jgi:hypothetical protein
MFDQDLASYTWKRGKYDDRRRLLDNVLDILVRRVRFREISSTEEMSHEDDEIPFSIDDTGLVTYLVQNPISQKSDQSEITWFRVK